MVLKYIDSITAQQIDDELMSERYGFTIEQLMELAGLCVANAAFHAYHTEQSNHSMQALVVCGPGNNGGDGLVAARHLQMFGIHTIVCYPRVRNVKNIFYSRLINQCREFGVEIIESLSEVTNMKRFSFIVDAVFGFSFRGPIRAGVYADILNTIQKCDVNIISIDVPSGWHVEQGNVNACELEPDVLVSLTAPKQCSRSFTGRRHYLGGRFVPSSIDDKYNLCLPTYSGVMQFVLLQ